MRPAQFGYCTNVHAGRDLDEYWRQLQTHALPVKQAFAPNQPLPLGLWFSERTAEELDSHPARLAMLGDWFAEAGLVPYTLNGFPQGDFHEAKVKHRVYLPTWMEPRRRDFTLTLVKLLDQLLPPGVPGTISTLPLAWGSPSLAPDARRKAAIHLLEVADQLARLEQTSGRHIMLCIEAEPGCALQCTADLIRFFSQDVAPERVTDDWRRYLGICHDVCHAAVMFESQSEVWRALRDAGISIGKAQISSAIEADFQQRTPAEIMDLSAALRSFAEDRYLHQTQVEDELGKIHFFEDLPQALAANPKPCGRWRIHFHVPIHHERMGPLRATRQEILDFLACPDVGNPLPALEVETYAWNVLPPQHRPSELAEGIAQELRWLNNAVRAVAP